MNWNDYPPILTTKQAAELLGITRLTTVTQQCKSGKFPALKIGNGAWRIDRDRLRLMFAPKDPLNKNLGDQLGEIELALATMVALHRDEDDAVIEALRQAHRAVLDACNTVKSD